MKKLKVFIISLISAGLMFSLLPINASDFRPEDEAHWRKVCNDPVQSQQNRDSCEAYKEFLDEKVSGAQDNVEKYKGQISKYQGDLEKQIELAEDYEKMIEEYSDEIDNLNNEIKEIEVIIKELEANIKLLEENILEIEAEIKAREEVIAEKDRIIVERMRKTQSDLRFGHEIDFLVKARDFSTLIASASVVTDILAFEAVQIEEINVLIDKQKEDQHAIELQKDKVNDNIQQAENKKNEATLLKDKATVLKEDVIVLKGEVEQAIANYKAKMQEIAALQSQATADANAIKQQMAKINKALEAVQTSGSFVRPVAGGYKSAGVWEYPNGWGMHLGYDYAVPAGTPIRAAANGVVLASYDTCPTYGGLGNYCGRPGMSGGGNQVFLLVTVDNQLYGATYFHMQSGSPIRSGQTVTAGQVIGRSGSSGNSSGPHVHAEVYFLGNRSISEYINNWSGRLDHGIGMSLANRCDSNGYSAPCRMDPGKAYGPN